MTESKIVYDLETTLSAPTGGVLQSIAVTVEIEPASAGCLIYGYRPDGDMGCIEVRGARTEIDLPFSGPKIYIKYLLGLKNIKVHTRGWKDNLSS